MRGMKESFFNLILFCLLLKLLRMPFLDFFEKKIYWSCKGRDFRILDLLDITKKIIFDLEIANRF